MLESEAWNLYTMCCLFYANAWQHSPRLWNSCDVFSKVFPTRLWNSCDVFGKVFPTRLWNSCDVFGKVFPTRLWNSFGKVLPARLACWRCCTVLPQNPTLYGVSRESYFQCGCF